MINRAFTFDRNTVVMGIKIIAKFFLPNISTQIMGLKMIVFLQAFCHSKATKQALMGIFMTHSITLATEI